MFLLLFFGCVLLLILFNYYERQKVSYKAAKLFVGPTIYPFFGNIFSFFFENAGMLKCNDMHLLYFYSIQSIYIR